VTLESLRQDREHVRVHLTVAGRPLHLLLVKERGRWHLDDVQTRIAGRQRSTKRLAALLIPALRLGHAVLSGSRSSFRAAFAKPLRAQAADPLLRILGRRFKPFMGRIRSALVPKPDRAAASDSGAPAAPHRRPATKGTDGQDGFELLELTHDVKKGLAGLRVRVGAKTEVAISLVRDPEQIWRIADVRFPLLGRPRALRKVGPVLAPVAGFGLALLAGDLRGVRRACSYGFNRAAWYKLSRKQLGKLLQQIRGKAGGGAGARRPPRPRPRASGAPSKARPSSTPELVALRIRDKARWPWAQVALRVAGRRILVSLVRVKGQWKVHDVHLKVGGLNLSVKKLIALGL